MSALQLDTGSLCWIPDEELGWLPVKIHKITNENDKYKIELHSENDPEKIITIETDSLEESNPQLPLMRNQSENVEDLTALSHLNEPSVLSVIKSRYSQFNMYTYSGIVLIAVNPFYKNDELYSDYIIKRYANTKRGEEDPHLFAIAEEAYRCMINRKENQSIVVSGESGAGKTVSAKYIMKYFASVDSDENHHESQTEKQILATNPIMEAFGNAKTTRNDNSSRFGKYLEILFDENTVICGAKIRTYLLERSRLVFQPKTERNYHIFYQMIAGLDEKVKESLYLTNVEDYHYLNQGGVPQIDGVDDKKEFEDTCSAMALIGINEEQQLEIFKILTGLLYLGNIEIPKTKNNASLSSDEPNLVKACELLGLNASDFAKWTVKKQIKTRFETINKDLKYNEAINAKDAVAKFIYHNMFDWLVSHINSDLCREEVEQKVATFIGVLDIYGFEHFAKNSFEQFCINYANEKLQQEFTQHVFKLEQELYKEEEIEWSFIEFADNQPCIDVIEKRLGVLDLLNEQARLPAGTDEQWADSLNANLAKPPTDKVFKKARFGNNKFTISHYALDVTYDTDGFVEKNRDTVSDGQRDALNASTNSFLVDILQTAEKLSDKPKEELKPGKKAPAKETLGSKFKGSLIELMSTINSSNVHYIRCIKPNEEKKAWGFDANMVLSQLRACGVLETIKISCAGFPSKMSYLEFADSFNVLFDSEERTKLLTGNSTEEDVKNLAEKFLNETIQDKQSFQVGLTKVFFKAGILGKVEKMKTDKHKQSALVLQKYLRGAYERKRYQEIRESAINLQAVVRGYLIRDRIQKEKEFNNAILLQSLFRAHIIRSKFNNAIRSLVQLQAIARGSNLRENVHRNIRDKAAVTIQTASRSFIARKKFEKIRNSAVIIQSSGRRYLAKQKLAALKQEAKSLNKMQEVQYSLENKVIELTQSLTGKIEENNKLISEINQLQQLVDKTQNDHNALKVKSTQTDNDNLAKIEDYKSDIVGLNEEIDRLKNEYNDARMKVDELTESQNKLRDELKDNLDQLKKAQQALSESKEENDGLYISINKLKSELKGLQDHLSTAKFNNAVAPVPNGTAPVGIPGNKSVAPNNEEVNGIEYDEQDDDEFTYITEEIRRLLKDSDRLYNEILNGIIKAIRLPKSLVSIPPPPTKEVLCPARIIIIMISDMWRLNLISESESLIGRVLTDIQDSVSHLKDENIVTYGAYWLTNAHELYSFACYAQSTIAGNEEVSTSMDPDAYSKFVKLLTDAKDDFESLSYNLYNMWIKKLMELLEKKIISAVVLGQSLPGFMASDSSPLISKMFTKEPKYNMDDVLTFFNDIYWAMKSYLFETDVIHTVIIDLLKFVNACCFNDLIMRRNFLSWKRGLQLNYNVMRLEEWCKSHEINDSPKYLSHLFQVSKLLQLRKNTPADVDILYDICHDLKPIQIQKLFSLYHIADYETPISPAISDTIAQKVRLTGQTEFLEHIETAFDDPFRLVELRPFHKIEGYVPTGLTIPMIRRLVELSTASASLQMNE